MKGEVTQLMARLIALWSESSCIRGAKVKARRRKYWKQLKMARSQ